LAQTNSNKKINLMKKIALLAIVAVGVSAASCKKNYTCECSVNGQVISGATYTIKDTKKKATTTCNNYETTWNTYGNNVDCAIK
jgi:hypothetical protein